MRGRIGDAWPLLHVVSAGRSARSGAAVPTLTGDCPLVLRG
jgi:hypothetical protein